MKQRILHSRLKIDLAEGKKVYICDDKVCYEEEGKEVILKKGIGMMRNEYMEMMIEEEGYDGWYRIMIEMDVREFKKVLKKSHELRNRKEFMDVMRRCYWELVYNYMTHMTLNMLEDTLIGGNKNYKYIRMKKKEQKKDKDVRWMIYRENKKQEELYTLPKNVYKIEDIYINTKTGVFMNKVEKEEVRIRGGIIVDKSDYNWMKKMILLLDNKVMKKNRREVGSLETRGTLIICRKGTIELWEELIGERKCVRISSRREHKKVTYREIKESEYVLVKKEYIVGLQYKKEWSAKLSAISNKGEMEGLKELREEYKRCEKQSVEAKEYPILSLIKWERIIVDETYYPRGNVRYKRRLLASIEAKYRWMHVKNISLIGNERTKKYMEYITNKKIEYPIYKEENIYMMKGIVREMKMKNKMRVVEKRTMIEMNEHERIIKRVYEGKISEKELGKLIDMIWMRYRSKKELERIIKKAMGGVIRENKICMICLDEMNEKAIAVCGHSYCMECILESLIYKASCPICRMEVEARYIYIQMAREMGSKMRKLKERIKKGTVIYTSVIETGKKLISIIKKSDICIGTRVRNKEVVERFNKGEIEVLVIDKNNKEISRKLRGVKRILIYEGNEGMGEKDEYMGREYMEGLGGKIEIERMCYYQVGL